ncbi:armadillo-like helical domain-containing protein 4 isoform X1 [Xenopus laevis]|uniref:Armadillo-like helical domain-containing protein 4 isoform X1 n=1 Tax=Xenopus laevis TaxID=8355 RepID=A0A8J0TLU3_XENLA|nr:armadillo-like helical domain-containing protein 4 isoform X1 [Xenopus laevis]
MKGSRHILIYMVFCTILLGSPLITGFSLHKLNLRETEDVLETTDHFDGLDENNNQSFQANLEEYQLTTPSTVTKASQGISDGASINNTFGVNEQQDNYNLSDNSSGKGESPEMNSSSFAVMLNPSGQAETLYENGILTTALSTVDYISKETSQSIDTGLDKNYGAEEEDNKKTDQQENSFQLNTMEMLTTSPRTSNIKATDSQASVSLHVNEPTAVSQISSDLKNENGSSTETNSVTDVTLESALSAYSNLETLTQVSPENRTAEITVPQQNSEWDDTKFSNVVPLPVTADIKSMKDKNVTTSSEAIVASSPTFPGIDAQSENNTNAIQNGSGFVSEENLQTNYSEPNTSETEITSTPPVNAMTEEHNASTSLLGSTVATRQIGADAKEQDTELSENPSGTTAPAFVIHSATEESIIEGFDNEGEETFPQESALDSAAPRLEDLKTKPKDDASLAISLSTILPVVIPGEAENLTPSITTQISQEQVPFPRRIEVPKSYRPDKLESEEGDEQDEEDDDEDDDGEQEEEDKDTDSVDESVEGDVALPPFTLPGLSFQDPGEDEIGRGAYHVPDALEWERQKQGLMRSWMEKLKDKAGYMSGMLIPVGVGVAGAILILGALYIIKIMNRRRRNGFKQHKRKQREFNSMQDRVMLLADSSEDEF